VAVAVASNFEERPHDPDVQAAMARLLDPESKLLGALEPFVIAYCKDVLANYPPEWSRPEVELDGSGDIWQYVSFGDTFIVTREVDGPYFEAGIYFDMECNCEWEVEHGLQFVIRGGDVVVKVGPYDGHPTNAHAYADETLRGVVYVPIGGLK
jgi:hypothetical protein